MNYGIIGCGNIGAAHAAALLGDARITTLYFYDNLQQRADTFAERYQGRSIAKLDHFIEKIEAVSITTSPASHYELALHFLKSGIPVFCEKPLALSEVQAAELVSFSQKHATPLMVGFKMRYEPVFQKAREEISKIGPLLAISTAKVQKAQVDNKTDKWLANVGAMNELSIHDFDLITFITGLAPTQLLASELSFRLGWPKEDGFHLIVKYDQDVTGSLTGCYVDEMGFEYRDISMTFIGEKGYLRVERPDRIILHTTTYSVIDVKATVNPFALELAGFLDHLNGDETKSRLSVCGSEGFVTASLIQAAYDGFYGKKMMPITLTKMH